MFLKPSRVALCSQEDHQLLVKGSNSVITVGNCGQIIIIKKR